MKWLPLLIVFGFLNAAQNGPALGADKPPKKLTCCEQAAAEGKECKHKCCVAAHKDSKSCEKCNPNKEDLKLKRKDSKGGKKVEK